MSTCYSRNFREVGCNTSISEKVKVIVQFCTIGPRGLTTKSFRINIWMRDMSSCDREKTGSLTHSSSEGKHTNWYYLLGCVCKYWALFRHKYAYMFGVNWTVTWPIRKYKIFLSQITDFKFNSQITDFHFVSFGVTNENKHVKNYKNLSNPCLT